jgi:hypothetical protein
MLRRGEKTFGLEMLSLGTKSYSVSSRVSGSRLWRTSGQKIEVFEDGSRKTLGLYRDCPERKAASQSISGGQFR